MGKGKKAAKVEALDDTEANECAGKSIIELIEDRLDEYIDELMDADIVGEMKKKEIAELKGHAGGLVEAIAIIKKPYLPNVEGIKEEMMDRYAERNPS